MEKLEDPNWRPWILPPTCRQPYSYPSVWIIRLGWAHPSLVDPRKLLPEVEEAGLFWRPHDGERQQDEPRGKWLAELGRLH